MSAPIMLQQAHSESGVGTLLRLSLSTRSLLCSYRSRSQSWISHVLRRQRAQLTCCNASCATSAINFCAANEIALVLRGKREEGGRRKRAGKCENYFAGTSTLRRQKTRQHAVEEKSTRNQWRNGGI
eukprot:1851472-Rhodomonas_salina.1